MSTTESLTTKHTCGVCQESSIKIFLLPSSHLCCHPRQVSIRGRQHGISIHHVAPETGSRLCGQQYPQAAAIICKGKQTGSNSVLAV